MEIRIVKAGMDDLDLLMEWRMRVLHEVFSVPADDTMVELEAENRTYYQTALPADGHIACFAYQEDMIVGCGGVCLYQEMPSPDNENGKCAYLMNIYTLPEYRHQGVGGSIVNWLISEAKKRDATKIFLETSQSGKAMYRKLGFGDMEDYMQLGI